MPAVFETLRENVQQNCHISDANHAGDYTLCIYLMKMREYYRWEQGQSFSDNLPNKQVGDWLRAREELWDSLGTAEFKPLEVDGAAYDPFDSEALNQALNPHGLVYSGGLGIQKKPLFFLGKLLQRKEYNGYTVLLSDNELARDLTSPPAMAQGKTIYIRRESLKRMLWEKLETWNWNQPDNALGRALGCYPFKQDIEQALEAMTENELESMLLHEIGEIKAGQILGEAWEQMLIKLPHSKAELMLRAVRDHLADALSTLPALLEKGQPASIHFYFGNLSNMRKHLYPALTHAYEQWLESGDMTFLIKQSRSGQSHWQALADESLTLADKDPDTAHLKIESLIENQRL